MATEPTLPRNVFRTAMAEGAHADCLVTGIDGACEQCRQTVINVFEAYYGHLSTTDASAAIAADFAVDIEEDEA